MFVLFKDALLSLLYGAVATFLLFMGYLGNDSTLFLATFITVIATIYLYGIVSSLRWNHALNLFLAAMPICYMFESFRAALLIAAIYALGQLTAFAYIRIAALLHRKDA